MPFPWGAVIGAAASIGTSLFASSSNRSAAASSKKDAKKLNKAQYKRAKIEYELANEQDATNYAWDVARTEATRYMENQKAADYKFTADRIYDQAIDNLTLNTSALMDKYGLEEQLRANQVIAANYDLHDELRLQRKMAIDKSKLAREDIEQEDLSNRAAAVTADATYNAQRKQVAEQSKLGIEKNSAQIKQYLTQVRDKRKQANAAVRGLEDNMSKLMAEQINDMSMTKLKRNIQVVASMMDQGAIKARSSQRGGGSSSARRLAMNEAQKLGRSYAEISNLRQKQGYQMELMNSDMAGPQAIALKRLALAMQNDVNQQNSLIRQSASTRRIATMQEEAIIAKRKQNMTQFHTSGRIIQNKLSRSGEELGWDRDNLMQRVWKGMRDLEIETQGFEIGARQGQRELTGLYINTQAQIDQASMPYRDAIIFDPLEPIEGLPPEKRIPSFSKPESPINSYANAILGGVNTALSFSKMTSEGLKFY